MASPTIPPPPPITATPNRTKRRHPATERGYVGITEAAAYLDVAPKTVRQMIADEKLRGYRLGSRLWKVKIVDLDAALTPTPGQGCESAPKPADDRDEERRRRILRALHDASPMTDEQAQRIAGLLLAGGA